jgi:uncharacterized protein (TIGR03437 family)
MRIDGNNLAKVATTLDGFAGTTVPGVLNGSQVKVAGNTAPLFYVGPGQILAQIPFETPAGSQAVVVTNGNGPGDAFNVTIVSAAPALFFDEIGGLILKNSDFSLVRPENPASLNDILLIYFTGGGQTTPALATGRLATFPPPFNTVPITVTIGGQDAPVIYSIASPMFAGLYQAAVRMPAVAGPTAPVVFKAGTATSNTVSIAVR